MDKALKDSIFNPKSPRTKEPIFNNDFPMKPMSREGNRVITQSM